MSDDMSRGASISECGLYRYQLARCWSNDDGPYATFVMLNPSTADALEDDPTIRRCIGFARSWGCVGLSVVNVYAFRATDPKALWTVRDPVGPSNDNWLAQEARHAAEDGGPIVAAWGVNAKPMRVMKVRSIPGMERLQCLGKTKDGHPKHPLYLRADSPLIPFAAGVGVQPEQKEN